MSKIKEFTFAGRQCKAAPPPFSQEACELVELFEETARVAELNGEKKPEDPGFVKFQKNGRLISLIRNVGKNCLVRGGHTPEEAEEILLSIEFNEDSETGIPAFVGALGLN